MTEVLGCNSVRRGPQIESVFQDPPLSRPVVDSDRELNIQTEMSSFARPPSRPPPPNLDMLITSTLKHSKPLLTSASVGAGGAQHLIFLLVDTNDPALSGF